MCGCAINILRRSQVLETGTDDRHRSAAMKRISTRRATKELGIAADIAKERDQLRAINAELLERLRHTEAILSSYGLESHAAAVLARAAIGKARGET